MQSAMSRSSHKRRQSASITLKVSAMSDSHLNYKHTNNPPLSNGHHHHHHHHHQHHAVDDTFDNAQQHPNIDMHQLIQSVKQERQKQELEHHHDDDDNHHHHPSSTHSSPPNGVHHHNNDNDNNGQQQHKLSRKHELRLRVPNNDGTLNNDAVAVDANGSPLYAIDPSKILEWDEIKNENEALQRKNRNRINLLTKSLEQPVLDSTALRRACWRGIPKCMRPSIWKLLLGYIPKNLSRREATLQRKRSEYIDLMERYYNQTNKEHRSDQENKIVHQIGLDVPRTSPELKLFQIECVKNVLSRALYIWALRHTATGYVQGINDLITPFVYIFLDEHLQQHFSLSLENFEISRQIIREKLTEKELLNIEADSYWCLDYLIEGLQMNYVDKQPGITVMVEQLEDVIKRVNQDLFQHFETQKIEIFQFAFRWMNCLLMRELSLANIIRLWDTYLCEGVELSAGFSEFHVFVCAALLLSFADLLMKKDFAEIMLFLQDLTAVTAKWGERQIETILSEAYVYQQLFGKNKKSLY